MPSGRELIRQRLPGRSRPRRRHAYDAFISYSHAVDGRLAPALQRALQRFAKAWYRPRALRIFRDEASLAANPGLWASIERALDASGHFLLLASPRAAASAWVARETAHWRQTKSVERLLIALTEGEIAWDEAAGDFDWQRTTALPEALRGAFAEEPRYIDLRWASTTDDLSLSHPQFRDAVAELAAPLHGRPKDEIAGEEVRQHRRTVRIARGAALALLALTIAAVVGGLVALNQRNHAREQERAAVARELAANSLLNLETDPELSLLLALEAARLDPSAQAENALRRALPSSFVHATLRGHTGAVRDAAFSPDGSLVATGSEDRTARIWDAATGRQLALLRVGPARQSAVIRTTGSEGHDAPVFHLEFDGEGERLLTVAQDGTTRVWSAESGRQLALLRDEADYRLTDAAFSPVDGDVVVTSTFLAQRALVWDLRDPAGSQRALQTGEDTVNDLAVSPDGMLVAGGTQSRALAKVWDTASGRQVATLRGHRDHYVWKVAWSPDGRFVATAGEDGTAKVFEPRSGALLETLRGHDGRLQDVRYSESGDRIITASDDETARIWDAGTGRLLGELVGHSATVNAAALSRDGRLAVTASEDGTARIWEASSGRMIADLRGHRGSVESAEINPDGTTVLTGSADGTARLWRVPDVAQGNTVPINGLAVAVSRDGRFAVSQDAGGFEEPLRPSLWRIDDGTRVAALPEIEAYDFKTEFSRDGRLVAVAPAGAYAEGADAAIDVWETETGRRVAQLPGNPEGVDALAFSSDARLLAAAARDGKTRIWNVGTGERVAEGGGTDGELATDLTFSPDGELVAVANQAGVAEVLAAADGTQRAIFRGHERAVDPRTDGRFPVNSIEFSPDGRRVLTASDEGTVQIWDAASGSSVLVLPAYEPAPPRYSRGVFATFTPDGARVVTAAHWDDTAHVWDARTGRRVASLAGHGDGLSGVHVSPDNRFVVTTSFDGTARIWEIATERQVSVVRSGDELFLSAAFVSQDRVASHTVGGRVMVFRCELCGSLDDLVALAEERVTRDLTAEERERYLRGR